MSDRSVSLQLKAEVAGFKAAMAEATKSVSGLKDTTESTTKSSGSSFKALASSARDNSAAFEQVGAALLTVGTAAGVGIAGAVTSYAQFEKAMSAAQAATRATGTELTSLKDAAISAGASTQYSATEAAEAITAMGKAGISSADILSGGLNGALNLAAAGQLEVGQAAEIAATALTQFGLSGRDIPHVADLLAAGAGKAQGEVTDLAGALKYVGPVAAGMGISIEETVGVLAEFASQSIVGEQAGTSLRGMLSALTSPSQQAKAELERLGVTLYDSSGKFLGLENAAGELQRAYSGMSDAQRDASLGMVFGNETVTAARVFYTNGADGVRTWTGAVDDSGFAAEQAAALTNNLAGDIERLGGSLSTAAIQAGEMSAGPLRNLAQDFTTLLDLFNDAPDGVQQTVTTLGGLTGAVSLTGGAALVAAPKMVELWDSLGRLGKAGDLAQSGLRGVGTILTGPWGLAIAAGVTAAGLFLNNQIETKQRVDELAASLDAQSGAITENTRRLAIKRLDDEGILATARELGLSLETVTDAALGNASALGEVNDALALTKATDGSGEYARLADGTTIATDRLGKLKDVLGVVASDTESAREAAERQAEAMGDQGDAAAGAAGSLDGLTAGNAQLAAAADVTTNSMGMSVDALKEWTDSAAGIADAFVDPLATYQQLLSAKEEAERRTAQATQATSDAGSQSWQDFAGTVSVSLDEYSTSLEEQIQNQRDWQTNLVIVAQRAGLGVAQQLQDMGVQGADLVAKFATATDDEMTRAATAMTTQADLGGAGAVSALQKQMAVMAAVGRTGGQQTAQQIAEQLNLGVGEVAQIAADYGVSLANGVNPVLTSLGKNAIRVTAGGYVQGNRKLYADGGIEDHVAQIAPAGSWRVWAEEETGGEAYIPLSPAKRTRSTEIWRETGRRLGQDVSLFADGGFTTASSVPGLPSVNPFRDLIGTPAIEAMSSARDAVTSFMDEIGTLFGGGFARSGKATPNGIGGLGPMAAAARRFVMGQFGLTNIGGYANRNIAGTGTKSDHATGHAIDVMIPNYKSPGSIALGNQVASYFVGNPGAYGTKYVIWRDQINSGGGWKPYRHPGGGGGDTLQHRDHVHVSFFNDGGLTYSAAAAGMKGSAGNPHVRDSGGPLLPGFTFNGTGRPETVLPVAPQDVRVVDAAALAGASADRAGQQVTFNVQARSTTEERQAKAIVQGLQDAVYANGLAGFVV